MNWRTELVLEHRTNATVATDAHLLLDDVATQMLAFEGWAPDEAVAFEELDYKHLAVSPNKAIELRNQGYLLVDKEDFDAVLVLRYAYSIIVKSVARAEALTAALKDVGLLANFAVVQVRRTMLR